MGRNLESRSRVTNVRIINCNSGTDLNITPWVWLREISQNKLPKAPLPARLFYRYVYRIVPIWIWQKLPGCLPHGPGTNYQGCSVVVLLRGARPADVSRRRHQRDGRRSIRWMNTAPVAGAAAATCFPLFPHQRSNITSPSAHRRPPVIMSNNSGDKHTIFSFEAVFHTRKDDIMLHCGPGSVWIKNLWPWMSKLHKI